MTRKIIALCVLCFFIGPSCVIAEARVLIDRHSNLSTFQPTDEWQPVKDQAIPPGLHVRFNLTSNTVEAKKMEPSSGNNPNTNIVAVPQDHLQQDSLEDKQKFRSYKKIKESLKKSNFEAKSEVTVMIDLVELAKEIINSKDANEKELLNVLADLNDRVEQIDVGAHFAKVGGIDDVVVASLNKTAEVKSSALLLLGSALQNNKPVQIAAYKAGLLNKLLAFIASEKDQVLARAMFSLSALVRQLPIAQKMMVDSGGPGLLLEVFDAHDPKIQGKILSLLYDLLIEQTDANLTLEEAEKEARNEMGKLQLKDALERQNLYHSIGIDQHLVNHGWCSRLINYLHQVQGERREIHKGDECPNISQPDHDKVEKALNLMVALKRGCKSDYRASKELPCTILRFREQYTALQRCENQKNQSERDEEVKHYFQNMLLRFNDLAYIITKGQRLQCKDEL